VVIIHGSKKQRSVRIQQPGATLCPRQNLVSGLDTKIGDLVHHRSQGQLRAGLRLPHNLEAGAASNAAARCRPLAWTRVGGPPDTRAAASAKTVATSSKGTLSEMAERRGMSTRKQVNELGTRRMQIPSTGVSLRKCLPSSSGHPLAYSLFGGRRVSWHPLGRR
jgi:hypothetical protein